MKRTLMNELTEGVNDLSKRRHRTIDDMAEAYPHIIEQQNAELKEIEQILGKALGYPMRKDDQKNFPGATEADGVCVGDNTACSLANEAAKRIEDLEDSQMDYINVN